ncbi:MAG: hypothetical protein R3F11_18625 [Verrucomicrobiales bacterium]
MGFVRPHAPQVGGHVEVRARFRFEQGELHRLLQRRAQIDVGEPRHRVFGEGGQRAGQVAGAGAAGFGIGKQFRAARADERLLAHQRDVATDPGQEVVEFVGNAAGQGPDGFRLGRLDAVLLLLAAARGVHQPDEHCRRAAPLQAAARRVQPTAPTIRSLVGQAFGKGARAAGQAAGLEALLLEKVGDEQRKIPVRQPARSIAEQPLRRRVRIEDAPFLRADDDQRVGLLPECALEPRRFQHRARIAGAESAGVLAPALDGPPFCDRKSRAQFRRPDRAQHHIIRAQRQQRRKVRLGISGGDQQGPGLRLRPIPPDPLRAADPRQRKVDHDHIKTPSLTRCHRPLGGIRQLDHMPLPRRRVPHHLALLGIRRDHQDVQDRQIDAPGHRGAAWLGASLRII